MNTIAGGVKLLSTRLVAAEAASGDWAAEGVKTLESWLGRHTGAGYARQYSRGSETQREQMASTGGQADLIHKAHDEDAGRSASIGNNTWPGGCRKG
ncbi:hypothetical protein [Spelaeicoccus albus]|uniref:Uncharacterized protein n=1 Tax=Spelaeicoccus albus TaxID=1280376 RepID=A0A7Z0D4C8_9MICO|nr:hypothetical protein [Spelaeicoccus albus]NYI68640.1 hypothetical protein [Spelaeicoccus albus]